MPIPVNQTSACDTRHAQAHDHDQRTTHTHELALCPRCHPAWASEGTLVGPGRTPTVHQCPHSGKAVGGSEHAHKHGTYTQQSGLNTFVKGVTGRGFEYCESSKNSLVYIRPIQGHSGGNMIAPELMGHVAIPHNGKELVFHRGCSFNINSILETDLLLEEEKARREDKPSSSHLSTLSGTIQMKKHPVTVYQYQGRCTTAAIGNVPKMLFIGNNCPVHKIKYCDFGKRNQRLHLQICKVISQNGDRTLFKRLSTPRPGSTQSSISFGTVRCVTLRSRRDSSQQNRFEPADRREAQKKRASNLARGCRAVAQLQESRDTLLDGTPEQNALSHRESEHQLHSGSKSRTSQTDTW